LLGIAILLLVLNMTLYLGNLIRFQKIVPTADQVLTVEQSIGNRIYAREKILSLYRTSQLTFNEAIKKAEEIEHPGDLIGTLGLLKRARDNTLKPIPTLDRVQYAHLWRKGMLSRSVGIVGHIAMTKQSYWFSVYQLIFLFAFLLLIRYWKPSEADGRLTDALFICLFTHSF